MSSLIQSLYAGRWLIADLIGRHYFTEGKRWLPVDADDDDVRRHPLRWFDSEQAARMYCAATPGGDKMQPVFLTPVAVPDGGDLPS